MKAIVTLATGNLPFVNADCILKYRTRPITSTAKPKTTVVAPNGLAYLCIAGVVGVMPPNEGFVEEKPDIVNS